MLGFEYAASFQLQVRSKSRSAAALQIRGTTRQGPFVLSHVTLADASTKTETFNLPDVPIWISVIDLVPVFGQGRCFVSINLAINGNPLYALLAGNVSRNKSLTWPAANLEVQGITSAETVNIVGSDPAAGSEISEFTPAEDEWILLGMRFTLVTSATAGNRIVHLVLRSGGTSPTSECISATAQAASLTRVYTCYPTTPGGSFADDNDIIIPIPQRIKLQDGEEIATETTGLLADDNFGAPTMTVERYFNPSF